MRGFLRRIGGGCVLEEWLEILAKPVGSDICEEIRSYPLNIRCLRIEGCAEISRFQMDV